MSRAVWFACALALCLAVAIVPGLAETTPAPPTNPLALDDNAIYRRSLAALTMLFVVAVLLESAFSVIFNWRVFLT